MSEIVALQDIERAGNYIAKSGLFGVKTPEQAIALMLVAQAEGRNPFEAARDYHIIQGRPALKADSILARFQQAGGTVHWVELSDTKAVAEFSHPQGGKVTIDWDLDRAKRAGLLGKENWRNYRCLKPLGHRSIRYVINQKICQLMTCPCPYRLPF